MTRETIHLNEHKNNRMPVREFMEASRRAQARQELRKDWLYNMVSPWAKEQLEREYLAKAP